MASQIITDDRTIYVYSTNRNWTDSTETIRWDFRIDTVSANLNSFLIYPLFWPFIVKPSTAIPFFIS